MSRGSDYEIERNVRLMTHLRAILFDYFAAHDHCLGTRLTEQPAPPVWGYRLTRPKLYFHEAAVREWLTGDRRTWWDDFAQVALSLAHTRPTKTIRGLDDQEAGRYPGWHWVCPAIAWLPGKNSTEYQFGPGMVLALERD